MLKIVRDVSKFGESLMFESGGPPLRSIGWLHGKGHSVGLLARNYQMTVPQVEEAIAWCERRRKAARKGWRTRRVRREKK